MKILTIMLIFCFGLMAGKAQSADESWYWTGSGQLFLRSYTGSAQLNSLSNFSVFLTGEYFERGGFTVGYSLDTFNYIPDSSNRRRNTDENTLFLSGKISFHPDQLPGRLTLRLDGYAGNEGISFTRTPSSMGGGSPRRTITAGDMFVAVNPMVSFLNYSKTFYADLGYAYSSYRSDDSADDIDISQWTPTLGFGFNRAYDWLQLRTYLISLSSSNRVGDKESTAALEAKWTHWFSADAPLNLHSARLILVAGERIYTVDSDARSLYNVPDLQTSGISFGAEWKLSEQTSLLLQSGYEAYEGVLLKDRYDSGYMYIYMSSRL